MKNKKSLSLPIFFIIVFGMLSSVAFLLFFILPQTSNPVDNPILSLPSNKDDEAFLDLIGSNVDVNDGIMIEKMDIKQAPESVGEPVNTLGYVVFNYTDENISFSNQGFGLEVYVFDGNIWRNYELKSKPFSGEKILPSNLTVLDLAALNFFVLPNEYVNLSNPKNFRLYVTGIGIISGTIYGAFVDVSLVP